MNASKFLDQSGQALMTLIVYVGIAIAVVSSAVVMVLVNSISTTKFEQGSDIYYQAENGIENALVRILRDPNYSGETLTNGTSLTVVQVSGLSTKIISSTATSGNFKRRIDATATFSDNVLVVQSWKEVF